MGSHALILLDTQQWVWFVTGDSRLSPEVAIRIDECAISAVSAWEVSLAIEKGRIESILNGEATVREWLARYPLQVIPLDAEIALLSRSLPFEHEDPADRFIAATAHRLKAPLATSDARLLGLPWLRTLE